LKLRHITTAAVFIYFLGVGGFSWAEDCQLEQSTQTILDSQDEIDNFQSLYGPCDSVPGRLFIGGYNGEAPGIFDLDGLNGLIAIEGELAIYRAPDLSSFGGLSNLINVGSIDFAIVPLLTSLDFLSNLTGAIASIQVHNTALTDLSGLEGLTAITYTFASGIYINSNPELESLRGIDNLRNTGDIARVAISGNTKLLDITALSALSSARGQIATEYFSFSNSSLVNVDGLINLGVIQAGLASVGIGGGTLGDCTALARAVNWPSGDISMTLPDGIDLTGAEGCRSVAEIIASVTGPTAPGLSMAIGLKEAIEVQFFEATTTDRLYPIDSYKATCEGSTFSETNSDSLPILDNVPSESAFTVEDFSEVPVNTTIQVSVDITHARPNQLRLSLLGPSGQSVLLWDQNGEGTQNIVGTFPTTIEPVEDLSALGAIASDGDWVLIVQDVVVGGVIREGILNSASLELTESMTQESGASPITVTGLREDKSYSCSVAALTLLGDGPSSGSSVTRVPTLPSRPVVTVEAGDQEAYLRISVVDGGSPITSFNATCTDGTNSYMATSATSPITVSGLANGVAYTCSVTATNTVGTSTASVPSAPVTPEESVQGLPIWLLYEATKD
jgi:subtilisin-like proprotein convertase family protein